VLRDCLWFEISAFRDDSSRSRKFVFVVIIYIKLELPDDSFGHTPGQKFGKNFLGNFQPFFCHLTDRSCAGWLTEWEQGRD